MQKFIKKMKKGFTIMELVIVIAVIAILAAVLIPTFSNITENANESAAMQECRNEWTNYSVEVYSGDVEGDDYLFTYKDGDREYNYVVVDGVFYVDPVDVDETTVTLPDDVDGYTAAAKGSEVKFPEGYVQASSNKVTMSVLTLTPETAQTNQN